MERCYKCGVSGDKEELFDAISGRGIVKACKNCVFQEHLNVMKRLQKKPIPQVKPPLSRDYSVKMGEQSTNMRNRLSKLSGINMEKRTEADMEVARQNRILRDVANRNFQAGMMKERGSTEDLVDNFNWAIMRARRGRRVSQGQMAEAIGEPESSIVMVEKGMVPKNVIPFIKKIENYLGLKLLKVDVLTEAPKLDFSSFSSSRDSRNLSIKDLKGMKSKNEEEILEEEENPEEEVDGETESEEDEEII